MKINNLLKVTAFTLVSCLTAEMLTVSPSQAQRQRFTGGCTLFAHFHQHAGLGGQSASVCYQGDKANLKDSCLRKNWRGKCVENMNDSIGSVSTSFDVTLYSDTNFQGDCITISGYAGRPRTVNLSQVGFDDVASSIRGAADRRCRVVK